MTTIIFSVFKAFLLLVIASLALTVVYIIGLMILEVIVDLWYSIKRMLKAKTTRTTRTTVKRKRPTNPNKSEIVDNIYEQAYQRVVEKDRSESKN